MQCDPALISIAPIEVSQWMAYKTLRLQMLHEEPQAFFSSADMEAAVADDVWIARLRNPLVVSIGAFCADAHLVGMLACVMDDRPKRKHVGALVSVYVDPKVRNAKVGTRLLDKIITDAPALGLRKLSLSVMADQEAAIAMYRSRKFEVIGTEREALCIGDRFYDELLMARFLP